MYYIHACKRVNDVTDRALLSWQVTDFASTFKLRISIQNRVLSSYLLWPMLACKPSVARKSAFVVISSDVSSLFKFPTPHSVALLSCKVAGSRICWQVITRRRETNTEFVSVIWTFHLRSFEQLHRFMPENAVRKVMRHWILWRRQKDFRLWRFPGIAHLPFWLEMNVKHWEVEKRYEKRK
jgi:hypothetical protein